MMRVILCDDVTNAVFGLIDWPEHTKCKNKII